MLSQWFVRSRMGLSCTAAMGGLLIAAAGPAEAGPVYLSQERKIEAFSSASASDSKSSSDFALFDETAEIFEEHPSNSPDTNVVASAHVVTGQRSALESDGFSVAHSLFVETTGDGHNNFSGVSRSLFEITFRLDEPHTYSMTKSATMDEQGFDARLSLFDNNDFTGPNGFDVDPYPMPESGVLAAGEYTFRSLVSGLSVEMGSVTGTLAFDLRLSPVNGNHPPVIPLPPAVWGGLLMLTGVAARRALPAVRTWRNRSL